MKEPRRAPAERRKRVAAVGLLAALAAAVIVLVLTQTGADHAARGHTGAVRSATPGPTHSTAAPSTPQASPAVGLRVLRLVDSSRTVAVGESAREPRTLLTYVRYPALAPGGGTDVRDAQPALSGGPYPLVVFGHGFAVTPGTYARLLQAWARAGFIVAAPAFPLENANAPGGPNEADLPNQPADMSFVITSLLAASNANGPLRGLIDASRVAVSGQSDGGDTALAVAYDPAHRDPRVGAAVILSGAEIPGTEGFAFPSAGPPLLAAQGTADTVNPPSLTNQFFAAAPRPKFLLELLGAEHLPPYTGEQPQLAIVEHVTIDFLDAYLRRSPAALTSMRAAAQVAGVASLVAQP